MKTKFQYQMPREDGKDSLWIAMAMFAVAAIVFAFGVWVNR